MTRSLLRSIAAVALLMATQAASPGAREVLMVPVDGAIGVATAEEVVAAIEEAEREGAELVVLRMDTPGGLDSAMRRIVKAILASRVPVATYVAPSGARAASAGTYILYASHIAAMAPATNLGAATPVQLGGLPDITPAPQGTGKETGAPSGDTMERKLVNDAVAYIRGLAVLRGRNADWAEQAVRQSQSLDAEAALKAGAIDLVAPDVGSLLGQIDGRTVQMPDGPRTLKTAGLTVREIEPGWRARLLSVIGDPNVAYLLLMLGIYGLIFELSSPGAVLPGVVGGISLLLALYALQMLPVNYAGLGLILLGVLLMVLEAHTPSFGALGLGGIAAFVFGSAILMRGNGVEVSIPVVGTASAFSAVFLMWLLGRLVRLRRTRPVAGVESLAGSIGEARDDFAGRGRVLVAGEVWQARTGVPVHRGERVRVIGARGLVLDVEPEDSGQPIGH